MDERTVVRQTKMKVEPSCSFFFSYFFVVTSFVRVFLFLSFFSLSFVYNKVKVFVFPKYHSHMGRKCFPGHPYKYSVVGFAGTLSFSHVVLVMDMVILFFFL